MNIWFGMGVRLRRGIGAVAIMALACSIAVPPAIGAQSKTKRVSVKSSGAQGNANSEEAAISETGRYIAFSSRAGNLVPNDTNGVADCFVRDMKKRTTTRVSVDSAGVQGSGRCTGPDISASGRFIVFESLSPDLVSNDDNDTWDVFVHDRVAGLTTIVSVDSAGDEGDRASRDAAISADGRYVAFESEATDLVAGDSNGHGDVFVHDRTTGSTTRVSVHSNGTQGDDQSADPDMSANGKFVVFSSEATNLTSGDTNSRSDIFIHDIAKARTSRVSIRSNGAQAKGGDSLNPAVSKTGRYVAFDSQARNLVRGDSNGASDVFVHDRAKDRTQRVSVRSGGRQDPGWSFDPSISDNGRRVAFTSTSRSLVPKDTNGKRDAFVHDRWKKRTRRVSVRTGGGQARGGHSQEPKISGDGRFFAFESKAKNLVKRDSSGKWDVFRRGPGS